MADGLGQIPECDVPGEYVRPTGLALPTLAAISVAQGTTPFPALVLAIRDGDLGERRMGSDPDLIGGQPRLSGHAASPPGNKRDLGTPNASAARALKSSEGRRWPSRTRVT